MTANEVFTTEIFEETHKVQWKIKNFIVLGNDPGCRDTFYIEVVTGKLSKFEVKWIIGFASTDNDSEPAPVPSQCSTLRPMGSEPVIYCKLAQLPNDVKKVMDKLCVNDNIPTPEYTYREPLMAHVIAQVNRSLTLNQQMEARYDNLNLCAKIDKEGSLVLNLELTVMIPVSVKSKPAQCLPD